MNIADVEHLLPRSVRMLIDVIGLRATIQLVETIPGAVVHVPRHERGQGAARFEELVEYIGYEATKRLCKHYGGDKLEVPVCGEAFREIRDRQIRADFDIMTVGHSASFAWSRLAVKYRMTERHVRRIIDAPDKTGHSETQMSLFAPGTG